MSALHDAVRRADEAEVERLVLEDVSLLESRNRLGETALHVAVVHAPQSTLRLLCSLGADPNARKNTGFTPLHEAAWLGRDSAVVVLLRFGADVHAVNAVSRLGAFTPPLPLSDV
jgi:ankyrin repeat protein